MRTATQPASAGLELVASSRGVRHRFLAYTFPSCSPHPAHPAVLNRRDFVEAAPTLPGDPRIGLPPALLRRYDGEEMAVFHPHPEMTAPRGALEADVGAQVARGPFISGHTWSFHTATAASSRSMAWRTGTWADQPCRRISFEVPSTVYPTWNSLPISALIRPASTAGHL